MATKLEVSPIDVPASGPSPTDRPQGASKYRDLVELGSGGMGDVYLSVVHGPAGFSKLLVVKRLRVSLAEDPELLAMFLTEARLAARVSHPNVVQTIEVGNDGSRHFIAMEYLDGQSLQGLLRKSQEVGGLPLAMHLRILSEALAGLHYAHELADIDGMPLGVVHRDATPHNVFVTYDGQVKVVDFGIAKVGDGDRTRTGVIKGKVPYMSPEQVDGTDVDRRTDVYAVGAMLWQAATGQRLWKGLSDLQVMTRVHQGMIPRPRDVNMLVPEKLDRIIMRALAHKKEERYATAAELQAEVEQLIDELGGRNSAREVGKFASELFAEERVKLKNIVETQLRALRESSARAVPLNGQDLPPGTLSIAAIQSAYPSTDTNPEGVHAHQSASFPGAAQPRTSQLEATPVPRRSSTLPFILGGLAAAGAIGAFVVLRGAGSKSSESTAPPTMTNTSTMTAAGGQSTTKSDGVSGVAGTLVQLEITVDPGEARVWLDDGAISSKYSSKMKLDGASHHVRAEAPGYVGRNEWIKFDHTPIELHWTLTAGSPDAPTATASVKPWSVSTKIPTTATGTATTTASAAPTSSGPTELDKPIPKTSKTAKPIDTSDPWK